MESLPQLEALKAKWQDLPRLTDTALVEVLDRRHRHHAPYQDIERVVVECLRLREEIWLALHHAGRHFDVDHRLRPTMTDVVVDLRRAKHGKRKEP